MGEVVVRGVEPFGNFVVGEHGSRLRDLYITPLGNLHRIGYRFGNPREEFSHLLRALHVELL